MRLNHSLVPMIDYHKAKRLIWDPREDSIFYHDLPNALMRLLTDTSHAAQAEAGCVYHVMIEGVLAETGYYGFGQALRARSLLPGLLRGIELVQRDEARHIAYGVYLLQRLIAGEPALWESVTARMNDLLPKAMGVIGDVSQ